jgi:16S rRNA (cytosine967-C5)-methyltransferase
VIDIILCTHRLLSAVFAGQNLNVALPVALGGSYAHGALSTSDQAAVRHLTYSSLRHWGLINAQIESLCTSAPKPALRLLLGVGLGLLQWTRTKPFVAVDQTVRAANALGFNSQRGFVNAVLRNYQRRAQELNAQSIGSPTALLNFPQWWITEVRRTTPHAEPVLQSQNEHPPMTLRVNQAKLSMQQAQSKLQEAGIAHQVVGPNALMLDQAIDVHRIPGFDIGEFSVQDAGAQLAARLLSIDGSCTRILDACAAPGGKTGHLLEQLRANGLREQVKVLALDVDAARMKQVESNLNRLAESCELRVANAATVDQWWDGEPFDRILLDAPCSASGTARRNPDIRWSRRESDIAQFAFTQRKLLDALWRVLKPGGKMLYSTCSIFKAENDEQISGFATTNKDCLVEYIDEEFGFFALKDGYLLPTTINDGFYYARLTKRVS